VALVRAFAGEKMHLTHEGNRWAGLHEVLEVIDRLGTHIPRGEVAGDGYTLDLCA